MSVLDDFFGDGSADNTPECTYCGGKDGNLIVSVRDANGPTHWHHEECEEKARAEREQELSSKEYRSEWELRSGGRRSE
jgi:hypothetical protein